MHDSSLRKFLFLSFFVVCFVGLLLLQEVFTSKDLMVVFLDVGQGDAIFIKSPTGKQVLIDAGKYSGIDSKVSSHLPFYDRSLDLVIATHPDLDHVGGFPLIFERFKVETFLHSGLLAGSSQYAYLADLIKETPTQIVTAQPGQVIDLGKGAYLQVLAPHFPLRSDDPNQHSVIVRLVYGETSALLTGDVGVLSEYNLVSVYGDSLASDILKLGHHGSKTSSSSLFLDIVNPEHAVVSASCGNSFGHPHAEVMQRVSEREIKTHETCLSGDIIFTSNSRQWKHKAK